jgi:oxysterol-binding protein-related protein 8
VKKPYNPVMGEYFRCKWDFADQGQAFYLAEQVSHHPPVSAYFYVHPGRKITVQGHLAPRSVRRPRVCV